MCRGRGLPSKHIGRSWVAKGREEGFIGRGRSGELGSVNTVPPAPPPILVLCAAFPNPLAPLLVLSSLGWGQGT